MTSASTPPQHATPWRVETLNASHFRCFERFETTFDEKLTVLVARNGEGKTACLDALAGILGAFVNQFPNASRRNYSSGDVRRVRHAERQNSMEAAADGLTVEASFLAPDGSASKRFTVSRSRGSSDRSRTTMKDAHHLKHIADTLHARVADMHDDMLPVMAYYGTGRLWREHRDMSPTEPHLSRFDGYINCLEPDSSFKLLDRQFGSWFRTSQASKFEAAESGTEPARVAEDDYVDVVKQAVSICLEPTGWSDVGYSIREETMTVSHAERGVLPVAAMSDGVRTMISLVADIALRSAQLNPQLGKAAADSPGIVLIDEVDMHLHPTWQQRVLPTLCRAFPHMQFVVTTHSPQTLSTVPARNIRVLTERPAPEEPDAESPAANDVTAIPPTAMGWVPSMSPLAQPAEFALQTVMSTPAIPSGNQHIDNVTELRTTLELLVRSGRENTDECSHTMRELQKHGYDVLDTDLALWRTLARYSGDLPGHQDA